MIKFNNGDIVAVIAPRFTCQDRNGDDVERAMVWNKTKKGYEIIPDTHGFRIDDSYVPDAKDLVYCQESYLFVP
ncbi:hypothetical protein [Methylocucumis oryzae]|uniref:Uncharacterized protein n=1 Tax=Methylocucumis oryzae TaxID=1632867 RepID=A0A0F3IMR0_9GAMM|nr:hypothetical protein [Methylocucumis oryzae]KJV08025.1 hypothetical protein VZ94_01035 [Methylocucumis oryzae]